MDISELLIFAVENQASDVHLSAGEPPLVRIHGEMRKIEVPALDAETIHRMIYDILSDDQRKIFEEFLELDFSLGLGDYGRFRVNVFKQNRGDAAAFRPIPNKIPGFRRCWRAFRVLKRALSSLRGRPAAAKRRRSLP
jgi:twitching motility protein PilT